MKKKIFLTGIMLAICSTFLTSCHKNDTDANPVESLASTSINQGEETTNEPAQSTTDKPSLGNTSESTTESVTCYTVTFDANGGAFADGSTTSSYTSYGIVVSVVAPTKEGADFTGWYKDKECSIEFSFDERINKDTTIYAGFSIKKFMMTFDCNGGAFTDKQAKVSYQMPYGANVAIPEDPIRDCYKFTGWYIDKSLEEEFDFSKPFTKTTTIYAGWEQTAFKVTFDFDGGKINDKTKEEVIINIGDTCEALTDTPIKPNYEFYGWYYDKDANNEFDPSLAITADTTVYAIYLEIDVSIKSVTGFDLIDNYIMASCTRDVESISLDGKVKLAPNCSYKIYLDNDCKNEITNITLEDGINEFYILVSATTSSKKVKYILYITKPELVNINFSVNGEIVYSEQEYTGEVYEIKYEPELAGYEFFWWCYDEECESMVDDVDYLFEVNSEITFYAYIEALENIKYMVNHFKMNSAGEYDELPAEVDEFAGITDTYTQAIAKEYEGFIAKEFNQEIINGDGSTVVNIYYDDISLISFYEAIEKMKSDSFISPKGTADFIVPTIVYTTYIGFTIDWNCNDELLSLDYVNEKLYVRNHFYLNTEASKRVSISATIYINDTFEVISYEFEIPKFVISTLAEYDQAASKTKLNVMGIITAVGSYYNNHAYIMVEDISKTSGYYGYNISLTEEAYQNDFKVGNTIILSGEKNVYYNTREFDNCKYYIVSTVAKEVNNTDITSAITSGAGLSNDLICQQVHFNNLPVISTSAIVKDGTFKILVGDSNDTSKQALIYINKYFTQINSEKYNIWKNLSLIPGDTISFHGIISGAKIDNKAQLYLEPYEANGIQIASHDYSIELIDALDKAFSLDNEISENTTYTLPNLASLALTNIENFEKYNIEWTSNNSLATINENVLSINLSDEDINITITLNIKDGDDILQTKSYIIKVLGIMPLIENELNTFINKIGTATITEKKQFTLELKEGFSSEVVIEDGITTVSFDSELCKIVVTPKEELEEANVTIIISYASFSSFKDIIIKNQLSNNPIIDLEEKTATWIAAEKNIYEKKDYSSLDITYKIGADSDYFNITVYPGSSKNIVYLNNESVPEKIRLYTDSSMKISTNSDENYDIEIKSIKIYGTKTTLERITLKKNDSTLIPTQANEYLKYVINSNEIMIYTSGEADLKKIEVTFTVTNNNLSDEDRASNELRRIINSIEETSFENNAEITLSAKPDFILDVNVASGFSSLTWDLENDKLLITPTDNLEEVDVTISITYNGVTKSSIITISSKLPDAPDGIKTGTYSINLNSSVNRGRNTDLKTDLTTILGANADIFEIYASKNNGTNNVFYKTDDFRTYKANGGSGNGSSIDIITKNISGYTIIIKSITVNGISGKLSAVWEDKTLTLASGEKVDINSSTVYLINKSTDTVKFKSIDLVYEIVKNS